MNDWNQEAADRACNQAESELVDLMDKDFEAVCLWWYKYYMACGHKALGRLLVSQVKETDLINRAEQLKQDNFI